MNELKSSFGVYTRSDGNSFVVKKSGLFSSSAKIKRQFKERVVTGKMILNIVELATMWHMPSDKIKIASIAWGSAVLSEPPDNLPIAAEKTEEEKTHINFFARTQHKNADAIFGIKDTDRARHIWAVGKSGTGKSTMIENMVFDDFKKDRGVALIDPHGDSCELLLNYVPSHRMNDVVYFNPADRDNPIVINPLEVVNQEEAELVVSGMMSVFTKVWANVWSARMEYILRNCLLTLTYIPGTTLSDVLTILTNNRFRAKVLEQIKDENIIRFWKDEYENMPEKLQKEAVSPIQNKVGQFVTSPMIRRIIGTPKSSIQIDEIMNQGRIMLCNLSQGRLGEDNSALLGAVLITKFQLAAMRRVDIPKEQRKQFYLFVDEFQNFATGSFIKILSEARKYGLNLMLANQYMAQIPEEVQKAILGNAGTLICFSIGAEDAAIVHKEFAEVFSENDLVNLSNYQIAIKLLVDWQSTRPFIANTLPLPEAKNQNKEKVIALSRERWAIKASDLDQNKIARAFDVDMSTPQPRPQNQYHQNQGNRPPYNSRPRYPQQQQHSGTGPRQHTPYRGQQQRPPMQPQQQQHQPQPQNRPQVQTPQEPVTSKIPSQETQK